MKKYLLKTISFLVILFVLIVSFELVTAKLIITNSDFKFENHPKYLVLGHSQPEHAFNDSIIDGLKNLAEGGESYFWTYHKSKKVIEQNPSLETVFITFTNNNIEQKRDAWTWDCYYMETRLDRFAPLLDIDGRVKLASHNLTCYTNTMSYELKERLSHLFERNLVFNEKLGGYKVTNKKNTTIKLNLTAEELRIKEVNSFVNDDDSYSQHNLFYLRKMIQHCYNEGKNVVLMRLPQQRDYLFWENEEKFQRLRKDYFNDIPFLDLSIFPADKDDFIDESHLSFQGARKFSLFFNKLLKSQYNNIIEGKISLFGYINSP